MGRAVEIEYLAMTVFEQKYYKSIGQMIRMERADQGQRVPNVAAKAGLTTEEWCWCELGYIKLNTQDLSNIAGALGVDVTLILPNMEKLHGASGRRDQETTNT
jgi:hypothetical protein